MWQVKVVDSEGKMVGTGEAGELCTRGYSTMLGYWQDQEKTDEVGTLPHSTRPLVLCRY